MMSLFDPPALITIAPIVLRQIGEEMTSSGVIGFDTMPVWNSWREAAKCAAENDPPDPMAIRGRDAAADSPATNGSMSTSAAHE
jgi:hypothetical protein